MELLSHLDTKLKDDIFIISIYKAKRCSLIVLRNETSTIVTKP